MNESLSSVERGRSCKCTNRINTIEKRKKRIGKKARWDFFAGINGEADLKHFTIVIVFGSDPAHLTRTIDTYSIGSKKKTCGNPRFRENKKKSEVKDCLLKSLNL